MRAIKVDWKSEGWTILPYERRPINTRPLAVVKAWVRRHVLRMKERILLVDANVSAGSPNRIYSLGEPTMLMFKAPRGYGKTAAILAEIEQEEERRDAP